MTNDRSKKFNVLALENWRWPLFLYIKFSWIGVNRESTKNYFPVILRITLINISTGTPLIGQFLGPKTPVRIEIRPIRGLFMIAGLIGEG